MIAKSGKGKGFSGLMAYLTKDDKLDWIEARNVTSINPQSIAKEMQIYSMNSRATKPVYHVSLSWDKNDNPSKQQMIEVGDRYLKHMGLNDHQAAIVSHKDGEHPHIHLMINRVHPVSEKAWEFYEYEGEGRGRKVLKGDFERTQEFLRKVEQEYGWRFVPGKHTEHGKGMEFDSSSPEVWEIRRGNELKEKAASMGFDPKGVDSRSPKLKAMEIKDDLFKVDSFEKFDECLSKQGLWLEPKGQGAVITDGYLSVKLSSVSRDLSTKNLEIKFGQDLRDYINYRNKGLDLNQGREQVNEALQLKFRTEINNAQNITRHMVRKISNELLLFERNSGALKIKQEIGRNFERAFVDGEKSYDKFIRYANDVGLIQAYGDISNDPKKFGEVKDEVELHIITDNLRSYIHTNEQAKSHINGWLESYYLQKLQSKKQHFQKAFANISSQKSPGKVADKMLMRSLANSEAGRDLLKIKQKSGRTVHRVREVISFHKAFQQSVAAGGTKLGNNIIKTIGGSKSAIAMKVMESSSQLLLNAAQTKELSR